MKLIDDSFIEYARDNQWCKDFADALIKSGLKLQIRASIRADKVNMDNMKHLKRAGFFSFSCGIESGSESALRRMGKLASSEDNSNALKCFREHGYYVQAGFILFDIETTLDELKENYLFMCENVDLITKGIFSEMFAAEGTEFTDNLQAEKGNQFSSNRLYEIEDENARKVYIYLRKWQSNHIEIYDKVIDPISAPKAIELHRMKEVDLMFMKDLLKQVECSGDVDALCNSYLQRYAEFFKACKLEVDRFYEEDGLLYDAETNNFILANNGQDAKQNC